MNNEKFLVGYVITEIRPLLALSATKTELAEGKATIEDLETTLKISPTKITLGALRLLISKRNNLEQMGINAQ
jgi:hypothetical protein